MSLTTPLLFCIFNRPEHTRRVFEAIRGHRPRSLFVVQDGPRPNSPADVGLIAKARAIIDEIDWPCDLRLNLADQNLGCRQRMATGIQWGFDQSERLIVLEDDCLPHPRFFSFCEELLERYAETPEVLMISGDNFQLQRRSMNSYYFSKYAHIWGWASWRRAWQLYSLDIPAWQRFRTSPAFEALCPDASERRHWTMILDQVARGEIDTWDYSWMFAGWLHGAWTVIPEANLVSNIGFGAGATHTIQETRLANLPTFDLGPLNHPKAIQRHLPADQWTWQQVFQPSPTQSAKPERPRRWRLRFRSFKRSRRVA